MFKLFRKNILQFLFISTFLFGFGVDYFHKHLDQDLIEIKKSESGENSSEENELKEEFLKHKLNFKCLSNCSNNVFQLIILLENTLVKSKIADLFVFSLFKLFLYHSSLIFYN